MPVGDQAAQLAAALAQVQQPQAQGNMMTPNERLLLRPSSYPHHGDRNGRFSVGSDMPVSDQAAQLAAVLTQMQRPAAYQPGLTPQAIATSKQPMVLGSLPQQAPPPSLVQAEKYLNAPQGAPYARSSLRGHDLAGELKGAAVLAGSGLPLGGAREIWPRNQANMTLPQTLGVNQSLPTLGR